MKLDIRRKILLLMGISGLITALLLGAILALGLNIAYNTLDMQAYTMAQGVGEEAVTYSQELTRKRLVELIRLKANHINEVVGEMEGNLVILSDVISQTSDTSSINQRILLKDPRIEKVYSGDWYYLSGADDYPPQDANNLANNLSATMINLTKAEKALPLYFYIGSNKGWSLRINILHDKNEQVILPASALTREYDARDRSWYKYVMKSDKKSEPVYIPLYNAAGDIPLMSIAMPYRDENGIAGVLGVSFPTSTLTDSIEDNTRDHSEMGFNLDSEGHVLFSTLSVDELAENRPDYDLRNSSNESLAQAAQHMTAGETGSTIVNLYGESYFLVYAPVGTQGWSLGELIEFSEVQEPANHIGFLVKSELKKIQYELQPIFSHVRTISLIAFVLLLITIFLVSRPMAEHFSRSVRTLSDGVKHITEGNFSEKLTLNSGDEMELLAERFNAMTSDLNTYMDDLTRVTQEQAKVTAGLDVATKIQKGMLPEGGITSPLVSLDAQMQPAIEVGGDFYDYYYLDDTHLAFTIADVSDKGIPSAIFMVVSKIILKNCISLYYQDSLATAVTLANDQCSQLSTDGMFVTVWTSVLNTETGELVYVNAGHNPPVLLHDKELIYLPKGKNPVIGFMEGIEYTQQSTMIKPDSLLFLYTDGITEAMNERKEMFSKERMEEVLKGLEDVSPKESIDIVGQAVAKFAGEANQSDDITMVAVKYTGIKG
ncbi:SpoIIE family protein phosphatase [Anaerovibrio sp. RM50]|uniref:SpoIIE family protein phosphatase n=1 Tax=Anaerovibrio sp. RM50 TaxID=1200557 RepID=UPI0018DB3FF9|nr:SpoIIE family protein phosphatase [Anaerovibrio sp. RM50]